MGPKNSKADERFAAIETDPRFKLPRKKSIRGEVDSRFKSALENDERFAKKAQIDKYGRKVKSKDAKKELSRYYNFDEDEEKSSNSKESSRRASSESDDDSASDGESENLEDSDSASSASSAEEDEVEVPKSAKPQYSKRDLMRGAGADDMSSSSDSDDSSEEDDEDSDSDSEASNDISAAEEDEYSQIKPTSIPQGDETRRIAVVNLDWDNVDSTDLMATFSSFVPANRRIESVRIYPSEYGKKQMQIEEMNGPPQELFSEREAKKEQKKKANVEVDDDLDYSSSSLRKYQLQRLQYYYAVVECDSVATASSIYTNCDGTEYESTANFFDLRYIPDDVDFSQDKPRDECHKVPASYQPRNFTTDALQHSKVKLTWDETPKERARMAQKAFTDKDVENEDLKAYLASDSESDEDQESVAERYRALLGTDSKPSGTKNAEEDEDDDAVEITFNPVLEGKEAKLEIVGSGSHSAAQQSEANPEDNLSTIERYRLKEKQRRLRRLENYKARKAAEQDAESKNADNNQAELELLALDDDLLTSAGRNASNKASDKAKSSKKLTKRATKKKAQEEAEQDFDTQDPRFQALFEDPDFAIDSTLPQFKKTKGMERIIDERRKRRDNGDAPITTASSKSKRKPETNSMDSALQLAKKLRRKNNL